MIVYITESMSNINSSSKSSEFKVIYKNLRLTFPTDNFTTDDTAPSVPDVTATGVDNSIFMVVDVIFPGW